MNKIAQKVDDQTIVVTDLTQFDPYSILHSGQVFRYFTIADGFLLLAANHWAVIKSQPQKIIIECDDANFFWNYFDLDTDYQLIKNQLTFPKLGNALSVGGGIRILKANFIEIVVSFIISANNNIKRFTKTLNALCARYGTPLAQQQFAFPTLEQLSQISEIDFQNLGCGYRSPYLVKAVRQLQNLDYQTLKDLPTSELNNELKKITGVGPKVAACVMLFAFHRFEVAPVDTWIKKALSQLNDTERQAIFDSPYAGVAQQYIFYYLQHLQREFL